MKILWFSRHEMTNAQKEDLDNIFGEKTEIIQVNKTIQSAYELQDDLAGCDVAAIVMPINLQEQMLRIASGKPVLICRNHRIPNEDGTYTFVHAGWDRLLKIEVIKETLSDYPKPNNSIR